MNMMAVVPGMSMGFALLSVVSQCIGAGDYEQVQYYTKKIMKWEYVIIVISNAIMISLLPVIMTFVLADSSKFGIVAPVSFAPIESGCIITDKLDDIKYKEHTVIKIV